VVRLGVPDAAPGRGGRAPGHLATAAAATTAASLSSSSADQETVLKEIARFVRAGPARPANPDATAGGAAGGAGAAGRADARRADGPGATSGTLARFSSSARAGRRSLSARRGARAQVPAGESRVSVQLEAGGGFLYYHPLSTIYDDAFQWPGLFRRPRARRQPGNQVQVTSHERPRRAAAAPGLSTVITGGPGRAWPPRPRPRRPLTRPGPGRQ
jgi:hypothetical protein